MDVREGGGGDSSLGRLRKSGWEEGVGAKPWARHTPARHRAGWQWQRGGEHVTVCMRAFNHNTQGKDDDALMYSRSVKNTTKITRLV